jgi:hypothetical protein
MSDIPVHEREILRALVGSTVHGLAIEGQDDRDEMGVCIEPPEYVMGLKHFEQHVFRTQPNGVRSGPGDIDRTIYSLRKYARLAANGNPTILLLLYSPNFLVPHGLGMDLRALAPAFASRRAGAAFHGYMRAQRQRLAGERGGMHAKPRADLVERYGFDTKYAMHMLRLGHQGVEYLTTGALTLPMREPTRQHLRDVREGKIEFQAVMTEAGELDRQLRDLLETSPLPDEPNFAAINRFLVRAHAVYWGAPDWYVTRLLAR